MQAWVIFSGLEMHYFSNTKGCFVLFCFLFCFASWPTLLLSPSIIFRMSLWMDCALFLAGNKICGVLILLLPRSYLECGYWQIGWALRNLLLVSWWSWVQGEARWCRICFGLVTLIGVRSVCSSQSTPSRCLVSSSRHYRLCQYTWWRLAQHCHKSRRRLCMV